MSAAGGKEAVKMAEAAESGFDGVEECLAALKRGEIVLVTDDEDRENEGDCICAAEAKHACARRALSSKK